MRRALRLAKILWVGYRFGLDEFALAADPTGRLPRLARAPLSFRTFDEPRAVRLRRALETLGPIFVKFGQVLSTRRDLLPPDIADELAKLQDQVPPFASELAVAEVERAFRKPIDDGLRVVRAHAGRERVGRAGAPRDAPRTAPRSR